MTARAEARLGRYTLGSLFTGIGGIDLAFVRAGFDVAFQVEIDDYCRKVLAKHAPTYWPNAQVFEDVKHVGASNLPNVDVLAGGFPCQDISSAGKRAGIKEGTRSGLWIEFARIIGEIRPRVVMLENVAAITSRDGTRVIADLAALGYDTEWGIIPASAVGAPHRRERWFCVAYATSRRETAEKQSGQLCGAFKSGLVNAHSERQQEQRGDFAAKSPFASIECPDGTRHESALGRIADGVSRQLDCHRWPAGRGPFQYEWEQPRSLNNVPNRRLRNKALGNAVVPAVVQPIAEAIHAYLQETTQATGAPTGDAPETAVASMTRHETSAPSQGGA